MKNSKEISFGTDVAGDIVAIVDNRHFKIDRDSFRFAIESALGPIPRASATDPASKPNPWADVDYLGTPVYIRATRFLKKGLSNTTAARVLGITDDQLRRLLVRGHDAEWSMQSTFKIITDQQEADEKDYCLAARSKGFQFDDKAKPRYAFINLNDVKTRECQRMTPTEIARELNLDEGDFKIWLEKNRALLDAM